ALSNGIDIINLITPATEEARIKQISKESSGFIYYVTSFGVTGERKNLNGKDLEKRIKNLRKWIKIPISAGFGISTPDQAGQISKYSDGIIIGSAIQKIIEENLSNRDNCKKSLKLFVAKVKSKVS
ncbi:MAG: tryptophan synthase subunit alpha, partial [Leptospiraceae bacterium]|nr:tryptophan synthase subunit alpha [Leptospiraceae bacterium]